MMLLIEELMEFIQANPDPREMKRALAVKMVMQNYALSTIGSILDECPVKNEAHPPSITGSAS